MVRRGREQPSLRGGDRNVLWLLHGLFRLGQRYREDPVLVNRLDLAGIYRIGQGHGPAVRPSWARSVKACFLKESTLLAPAYLTVPNDDPCNEGSGKTSFAYTGPAGANVQKPTVMN